MGSQNNNQSQTHGLLVQHDAVYTTHASLYDEIYFDEAKYENEIEFVLKRTALDPGHHEILDVGCGTGTHIASWARRGFRTHGVDLNEAMLRQSQTKCPGATLHQGDMRNFNFGRTFDLVTCMFGAINYVESRVDLDLAVQNLFRHTRPGGHVAFETRWSRTLPADAWFERIGDAVIGKKWTTGEGREGSDLYALTYIHLASNLMFLDVHHMFNQDPFALVELLERTGFADVGLFENRHLPLPFTRTTQENEAMIVARKPGV